LEKFTSYSQEEDGRTASQASQPQEQARSSSHSPPPHPSFPLVDLPPHEVLSMPALSPTMVCCGLSTHLMAQNFLKVSKLRGKCHAIRVVRGLTISWIFFCRPRGMLALGKRRKETR